MELLATPHLWTIYETSGCLSPCKVEDSPLLRLLLRTGTVLSGAIALLMVSPQLQARNFPGAGPARIDPPPGYNVNIRSGPGIQFQAVNTLSPGDLITLTGAYQNGWAQLTNDSWVAGNLISSSASSPGSASRSRAVIDSSEGFSVNIRTGPGLQFPVVNTLSRGTVINITGRYQNGWAELTSGNWVAGYLIRVTGPIEDSSPQPTDRTDTEFLRVGARSPAVIPLERRLRELGYVTNNFVPNEYYGTDTAQAIRNFQRRNNLFVDGVAGSVTRTALYSTNAIPRVTQATTGQPDPPTSTPSPTPSPNPPSPSPSPNPPANPPNQGTLRDARVSTRDGTEALIFSGPSTEFDIVGFIADGETVSLTGRTQNNWSELSDGSWIYTEFLSF
ncbi:SH3 domain-containing protein [Oscillatoria sp. CS-180]|uniref:SH3 domain-containing protein n=1 Tax=Oscillatoria sp. CS-180 TaxID=3021720 RepID=UPI00232B6EBD|nr:SH3 domain-containing protein [Oscillatoria sp. CS-180]MDB9526715.1 SH3 domain-containing protein [Oscillatoria sp. CS-180]